MSTELANTMSTRLETILDRLACPACRAALGTDGAQLKCTRCREAYPIDAGIPLLAGTGTAGAWQPQAATETSVPYQQGFLSIEGARHYRQVYEGKWSKRMTTRREIRVLTRIMAGLGRTSVLLDLPCGNGRVSAPLAASADLLVEADLGRGQVVLGRQLADWSTPTIWMTASAFQIPFGDGAVEGTVCNRLIHHLPSSEERAQLGWGQTASRCPVGRRYRADGAPLRCPCRRQSASLSDRLRSALCGAAQDAGMIGSNGTSLDFPAAIFH